MTRLEKLQAQEDYRQKCLAIMSSNKSARCKDFVKDILAQITPASDKPTQAQAEWINKLFAELNPAIQAEAAAEMAMAKERLVNEAQTPMIEKARAHGLKYKTFKVEKFMEWYDAKPASWKSKYVGRPFIWFILRRRQERAAQYRPSLEDPAAECVEPEQTDETVEVDLWQCKDTS